MNFLWPKSLWLLALLPLLPLLYAWLLRRRGKPALRLSTIGVARAAAGRSWRRHVPPALFLAALAVLVLALARPTTPVSLPWSRSTILLAIDVSLSMRVSDVKPTRMVAAQEAARTFLRDLPKDIEVGLVTFAGTAQMAQQPTLDRPSVVEAIDRIQMQYGTAIGNAIVVCLAELFPDHGLDLGEMQFGARRGGGNGPGLERKGDGKGDGRGEKARAAPKQFTPVPVGSYDSAAIILLSDGRRTTGVDTIEAAKMAADRGVRVYVIGLGTVDGVASMGEGMAIYLQLDEPTLRLVARMTGGEYHHAGTAEDLRSVYQNLGSQMQMKKRDTELTALLAALAALLVVVASSLSVLWYARIA